MTKEEEKFYDLTHRWVFSVPKMPWHTDDHKFGESSDKVEPEPPVRRSFTVFHVNEGKCYYCHSKAAYAFMSKLYCPTCWYSEDNGEVSKDEDR